MSKSNNRGFIIRLFVLVVTLAFVGADLVVSAQNTNSSTTMQNDNTSTQNSNMSGTKTNRHSRRNRSGSNRKIVGFPKGQTSTDMQNAELERTIGKPEDFTGQSYSGTVNYPGGNLSGPAKLEFMADNQFSLTPEGGQAMTGRYSAVTTRGYTGMTMMFGTASGPTTPATIISVRVKKVGNGLQITNVPEESKQFSFSSSGGNSAGSRRPVHRRSGAGRAIKPPTE